MLAYSPLLEWFSVAPMRMVTEAAGYKSNILKSFGGQRMRPRKRSSVFSPSFRCIHFLLESVSAWPISKYKAISPNVDIKRANLSSNSPSVKPTQRNARMFPQRVRLWCGGGLCVGLLLNRQHKNLRFMASAQLEFADVYR